MTEFSLRAGDLIFGHTMQAETLITFPRLIFFKKKVVSFRKRKWFPSWL